LVFITALIRKLLAGGDTQLKTAGFKYEFRQFLFKTLNNGERAAPTKSCEGRSLQFNVRSFGSF
jgi:hypothetical protein